MKTLALLILLVLAPFSSAAAQNTLDDAKAQYEAAAYEDALATLAHLEEEAPANRIQVEQYRALCLIALGNVREAHRAVAALVALDPTYVPSPNVASPKVLSLIAEIRRKELPLVARRLLDDGRTAFQANDRSGARQAFDLLLEILEDPAMTERSERDDLRALAEGFLALTAAAPAPAAPDPAPAAITASLPAPLPARPLESMTRTPVVEPDGFVPAVAINQTLPPWNPPSATVARFEYDGRLRVRIGEDGKVTDVSIDEVSHPSYDAKLLQVAQEWQYRPATRNGTPVQSERVIAITLRAQP